MESKSSITPVCGVICDMCPAFNLESNPHCEVMRAAIRAFQAQDDYWMLKIQHEGLGH